MSHLVAGTTERFDLQEMLDELRGAHTYLAKHGARALMHAADLGASPTWGQSVIGRVTPRLIMPASPDPMEGTPNES